MKAYFLIYIGYFSLLWLKYPLFLPIYETFRFSNYRRLTKESNQVSWGLEPLVLMGHEPIRDNGGNKLTCVV